MSWRLQTVSLASSLLLSLSICAKEVQVTVLDIDGEPVPDVAVYAKLIDSTAAPAASTYAVMDQVDTRFEPHILVIQVGTEVRFPNSDVIAHHVYSFSNPNDFILPLYKGDAHAPVTFEDAGVVTLGCNIHDQMLGYIFVVESSVYAMTDVDGVATFSIDNGSASAINIWSPRIGQKEKNLSVDITAELPDQLVFRLSTKLRAAHDSNQGALKWSDY